MKGFQFTLLLLLGLFCNYDVFAQRFYSEYDMDKFNLLVELQGHLDTLQLKLGKDFNLTAYVAGESAYEIDSVVPYYNKSGKIIKTAWYHTSDDGFYLDVTYTHYYDDFGRLREMEYLSSSDDFWSHRYLFFYNPDNTLQSVLNYVFTYTEVDTNSRYLYHYQNGLLDTVLYQGWEPNGWVDKNRRVYDWDSMGNLVFENWESTASNGKFESMFYYPKTFEYDSSGKLQYEYLSSNPDDTLRLRKKYDYVNGLIAIEYIEFIKNDVIESDPSKYYWYNSDSLITETLFGWTIKEIWYPTARCSYSYYNNGLLKSNITLSKFPTGIIWDDVSDIRRYFYNRID